MNNENQKFNPQITPAMEMAEFTKEADQIAEQLPQDIDSSNQAAAAAGVEVVPSVSAAGPAPGPEAAQADLDAHKDDDLEKPDRQARLGKLAAGSAAAVAAVGLAASALGGGEIPAEPAPNPSAPVEDVATTQDGTTVEVVDANYVQQLPGNPSDMVVEIDNSSKIGGDKDGDGYIDDTDPATAGNQATLGQ